jgi:hypothetical protein
MMRDLHRKSENKILDYDAEKYNLKSPSHAQLDEVPNTIPLNCSIYLLLQADVFFVLKFIINFGSTGNFRSARL